MFKISWKNWSSLPLSKRRIISKQRSAEKKVNQCKYIIEIQFKQGKRKCKWIFLHQNIIVFCTVFHELGNGNKEILF